MEKRLKIAQIAARTQLSVSTVSRVLAGKANTSPAAPVATRRGPVCPHCHKVMLRVGTWRTPQDLLGLFAAWRALRQPDTHPP